MHHESAMFPDLRTITINIANQMTIVVCGLLLSSTFTTALYSKTGSQATVLRKKHKGSLKTWAFLDLRHRTYSMNLEYLSGQPARKCSVTDGDTDHKTTVDGKMALMLPSLLPTAFVSGFARLFLLNVG